MCTNYLVLFLKKFATYPLWRSLVDQMQWKAPFHASSKTWAWILRSLCMCIHCGLRQQPCGAWKFRRSTSYMCRCYGRQTIGGGFETISMRCPSDGGTKIRTEPLTVERYMRNPSELILNWLLAWPPWAVTVRQKTSCFRARVSMTMFGRSYVGLTAIFRRFLCLRRVCCYCVYLWLKCVHLRHDHWQRTVARHEVGFCLCLWWRVAIAYRWLGA